jgi:hypothetical protein
MMWFLLGVEDVIVKGKKLEEYLGPLGVYYGGKTEEEVRVDRQTADSAA